MRRETSVTRTVNAPADWVFGIVSDHEGTPSWVPKVRDVTLLQPGTPKNGVPAVRRVEFRPLGWGTIDEKIVAYDPESHTFSYTIIGGMLGVTDHLGTFTVVEDEEGCSVTWAVWFEFNPWIWAPFAGLFVRTFTAAMAEGLDALASASTQTIASDKV